MTTKARIASLLNTATLEPTITGLRSFDLKELDVPRSLQFDLPTNLRLGHLIEKVVSELIGHSENYNLLHENMQLTVEKQTIGELDFLIQRTDDLSITHLELAYKFYLYDPTQSDSALHCWIGPNRSDSLHQKLTKLKDKQFPLLFNDAAQEVLKGLNLDETSQALSFLVSLYVPFGYEHPIDSQFKTAIVGYYMDFKTFLNQQFENSRYFIPPKSQWGIHPSYNKDWVELRTIRDQIKDVLNAKQSVLCWQTDGTEYQQLFIVWW